MIHFAGNPKCTRRAGRKHILSDVTSLDDFRELCHWRPAVYCSECAEAPLTSPRTDSDRYAELRKLVEDTQREAMDPASPLVVFDNALRLLLDWSHR